MGMVKIIDPRGWGWDQPIAHHVKVSSRGLIGNDRGDFLKMASHEFVDMIDSMKVAKDEMPVHLLALGASEAYGFNRNGDGFKEATCKKHHKTFEKFARWFRNHKNKDKAKSYGYIKQSAYNEAMRRVELMCMLNKTAEAAERNGGLVATQEIEKLAAGEDLPVSMACRVPYDVCSGCGNKARTRSEYCKSASCKYGGCSQNLTKVAEDGHILGVYNPDPTWFDISKVYRPADRIAYGGMADYLQKAASATEFMGGAELADALGIAAPLGVILSQDQPYSYGTSIDGQIKLAYGLAMLEKKGHRIRPETARAFTSQVQPEVNAESFILMGGPGTEKAAECLGAMADQKIILPLRDFARWIGKSAEADGAVMFLPGIFTRLVENGGLEHRLGSNKYAISEKTASVVQRTLSRNLAGQMSIGRDQVRERAMLSTMRSPAPPVLKSTFSGEKQAADNSEASALAEEYGLYKLAALHRIASIDQEFNLTGHLAIAQNCV